MFRATMSAASRFLKRRSVAVILAASLTASLAGAQEKPAPASTGSRDDQGNPKSLSDQVAALTALVQKLQARVADLEQRANREQSVTARDSAPAVDPPPAPSVQPAQTALAGAGAGDPKSPQPPDPTSPALNILRDTTVNFLFDGYYGFNFNSPIGRANLLRAYDVSSNTFNLSQADLVLENAPDPSHGKPFGLRFDLQYGQATSTSQGNAANEPQPDVYRNIFQAYGTYVIPVGGGLTVDFGKWASSLGLEGNYSKDQINYSRSFWFDFLPYYHMGARFNYKVNDLLSLNYWITNGTNQTQPYNGFKDELVGLNIQPAKNLAWTVNYYLGQEHPDFEYLPGSTQPNLPTQQGVPFEPIPNAPKGKLHIFDSYLTWTATPRLTLAMEGDYVIERLYTTSAPAHTIGGAGYARYQISPRVAVAARTEYFSDRGGLFSGATQALKEDTVTLEQKMAEGFLLREEWRRDASNHPYFLTSTLGVLKKEQNTATLGVVWWFGTKQGAW